ncbi:MAG: hypothetical protein JSW51_10245 [Gemmatimonadota bacterium]|nr:MAG: hypothetical protein JSW51_10245 [Gemmatimonadota bacterium]
MSTQVARRGSIPKAMAWMVGLSVALFWIPLLGSLIAGFVGGRKAGGIGEGVIAALLPGVILLLTSVLLGSLLGWIPIIGQLVGWILGLGAWVLGFVNVIPLLLGAAIGGATAK